MPPHSFPLIFIAARERVIVSFSIHLLFVSLSFVSVASDCSGVALSSSSSRSFVIPVYLLSSSFCLLLSSDPLSPGRWDRGWQPMATIDSHVAQISFAFNRYLFTVSFSFLRLCGDLFYLHCLAKLEIGFRSDFGFAF
jgi:hypothetical protein